MTPERLGIIYQGVGDDVRLVLAGAKAGPRRERRKEKLDVRTQWLITTVRLSNDLPRPTIDEWNGYEPRWNDATHEASKTNVGRGVERFD